MNIFKNFNNNISISLSDADGNRDSHSEQRDRRFFNERPNQAKKQGGRGYNRGNARYSGNRPPASSNAFQPPRDQREKSGRGDGRPQSKSPGMNDPYGIDIAPLNIFENQVIPIGVHNLSKSFRPNMATIRVLSLGTKFIPKWRDTNIKNIFRKFGDFKRRLQNSMFFVETTPGTYCLNKQFRLKNYFVARDSSPEIDEFCWQLRDGINDIVENLQKTMSTPI